MRAAVGTRLRFIYILTKNNQSAKDISRPFSLPPLTGIINTRRQAKPSFASPYKRLRLLHRHVVWLSTSAFGNSATIRNSHRDTEAARRFPSLFEMAVVSVSYTQASEHAFFDAFVGQRGLFLLARWTDKHRAGIISNATPSHGAPVVSPKAIGSGLKSPHTLNEEHTHR